MKWFAVLALGLLLGAISAQAEQPAAKGGKAKPAAKAPAKLIGDDEASEEVAPAQEKEISPAEFKALMKKMSYMIGMDIGTRIKGQGLEISPEDFLSGMQAAMDGKVPEITPEEAQQVSAAFERAMTQKLLAAAKQAEAKGKEFLAANKKKEGVKTTASGLQYRVLKSGKGKSPEASDTVLANYKGTFIDGKEFDSSAKYGEGPAKFPLNRVIKGWTEAMQMMKVGDKWELVIPSDLAYGPKGDRGIPPNSTLVFEIELVGIEE